MPFCSTAAGKALIAPFIAGPFCLALGCSSTSERPPARETSCEPSCAGSASGGAGGKDPLFGEAGAESGGGGPTAGEGGAGGVAQTASLFSISGLSIYQGTEVSLVRDARRWSPPLVADRPALVRISVETFAGFRPIAVEARLELLGGTPETLRKAALVAADSRESELDSTLNFELEAEQLSQPRTLSVSLFDPESGLLLSSQSGPARYPPTGELPVDVQSAGGPLRVVIVPVEMLGRLPRLGPAELEAYRTRLFALFPVPAIELSVRAAFSYSEQVFADGRGWTALLDSLLALRAEDEASANVFYYGALAPDVSEELYCPDGCVLGASFVPTAQDGFGRGAVGVGFFPEGASPEAVDTMAHELGHALGLDHTPCGTDDPGNYPYADGRIASYGYDLTRKELVDPLEFFDIMGYCAPAFISDFHFDRLFQRTAYVNARAELRFADESPEQYRSLIVGRDGRLAWGRVHTLGRAPRGALRPLELLNAAGNRVGEVKGFHYQVADAGGEVYLLPVDAAYQRLRSVSLRPMAVGDRSRTGLQLLPAR